MKILKSVLLMLLVSLVGIPVAKSQDDASKVEAKKPAEWVELKSFHKVISQTFHPAEEGDFKPIRERSGELMEAANELNNSKAPEEFNKDDIKKATEALATKTKNLHQLVQGEITDEDLMTSLNDVHDTFHTIVGLCKPGKHEHEGHDHDGHGHEGHGHD